MSRSLAEESLLRMDAVLAKRPHKDGALLTETTKALCGYREILIIRARRGGPADRMRLERLNAVLSITAGLHFPLGAPPWDEFEKARTWLKELAEEETAEV